MPVTMQRQCPAIGSPSARICIIGEAAGSEEERQGKPFVGPAGSVLEACLHTAGISRSDCYITNVVKIRPKGNDITPFFNPHTGTFTAAGIPWLESLHEELARVQSNILVPLGAVAMAAVTGKRKISKYRGYIMESLGSLGSRKVLPTIHPAAALRGNYIFRYYISNDLRKARIESAFPDIRRPTRRLVVPETLSEVLEWLHYLNGLERWACDIEVMNFEVSCIGFAPDPTLAVSIPLYHQKWSVSEECTIWYQLATLLENPKITKVFQNGIFDIQFLMNRCAIHVAPPIEDTMIAHHVMYPEMLKGLEFLVSSYCGAQAYYKDMIKWDNIKEDS